MEISEPKHIQVVPKKMDEENIERMEKGRPFEECIF